MKKIISIVLTIFMLASVCAYAADYVTLTQSNKTQTTYYPAKTFWDIDFDSTYTVPQGGGAIKKNGADLIIAEELNEFDNESSNMKGETATTNVGNAVNKSTISNDEAVADANHDYFLKLETTADGKGYEVQMNQMPIIATGGIVVVQNDFAVGTIPTGNNYVRISHLQLNGGDLASYNTNPASSAMLVTADGVIKVGNTTTKIKVEANEWHTATQVVDFDAKRINYYIDGEYVGYLTSENIVLLWKMCFYHPKNGSDELVTYYDKIKVFKATTEMLEISAEDVSATVMEGSVVNLATKANTAEVKDIKIFASTDGTNYKLYSEADTATASYKKYTTYYKAFGYDVNGAKIGESAPVVIKTNMTKNSGTTYWDVDFEEGYSMKGNGGAVLYNGKNATSSNGSTFSTNAGAEGCVIKIDSVSGISGNASDRVLVLDNTGATEPNAADTPITAQINALNLGTTDNILVCEYSFAFNELPTISNNIIGRIEGTYVNTDTGRTFDNSTIINLDTAGRLYIPAIGTRNAINAAPNTWYNVRQVINLAEKKTDTYIDDQYMGTVGFNADKNWTKLRRFSASTGVTQKTVDGAKLYYANNNILYYDNFNFYSVETAAASALKIDEANYFINGKAASSMKAGNLTAEVILSNNGADNAEIMCIAAVYSTLGELERVITVPVSFDAAEIAKLVEFDLGAVTEDSVVKIFFWTEGDNTNTPHGANITFSK